VERHRFSPDQPSVRISSNPSHSGNRSGPQLPSSTELQQSRGHEFVAARVPFMRIVLAHAGKSGRRVVSAVIANAFAQHDAEAEDTMAQVADRFRLK
jgi:hypothetical protein